MNNMVYVGVGIIVIIIIAGVFVLGSHNAGTAASTTAAAGSGYTSAATTSLPSDFTTGPTTTVGVNNTYNTTTTIPKGNVTTASSTPGCVASKYFTCGNVTYANSELSLTISQDTGTSWSAFGVAYAPAGTKLSQGVPENVTFYIVNESKSNVGASLANNASATIAVPIKGAASAVSGAVWVCYINSGILYVANGCSTNTGAPAQYVQVATINVTAS